MSRKNLKVLLITSMLVLFSMSCEPRPQDAANKPKSRAEEIAERETKNQKARQEDIDREFAQIDGRVQSNPTVANLVAKYNAVIYWGEDLRAVKQLFSVNVQEALIRADKRPILIFTQIKDVVKENGKSILKFETDTNFDFGELYFSLECTSEQVNIIINQTSTSEDEYAIVALISSVRKPELKVSANAINEDEALIELSDSHILLASGTCLDLVNIGINEQ